MDFLELATSRFSERRFADTPVEDEKLRRVLEVGRLAPTAENKQPQRIYVVRGAEGLEKMDAGTRCRFGAPVGLIDPSELRRRFDIPKEQRIISVMPLGYPSERSRPAHLHAKRKPLEETVSFLD